MQKNSVLAEHLIISLISLLVSLGFVAAFLFLVRDILSNPEWYFGTKLAQTEIQFAVICVSLVVISVLISYIIYLLLSAKTRSELVALRNTRSLSESRNQFLNLYELAPVPYVTLNKKGEIQNPNKAALRFFGATSEEIEGKNIFSYLADEEKAEKFFRYFRSNVPIDREEIKVSTKNDPAKWALLSIFEMKGIGDPDQTGLATIFDITEQKKLDQAKTEFVSLASHQLRTPVSTLKWYAGMLLSGDLGELSPKQNDYLARIYRVNEGMIDLIDTLLNVSRLEIGSIKMDLKQVNAAELAESVVEELSSQIEEKNLKINKQFDGKLEDVRSDPKFLRIAIQNLVSNSVKYTPAGGEITIEFKDSFFEKAIIVSDNGVGIPDNQQDKIFSKMFRADNVRALEGSYGTGLGLYLVKSIVEAMGGSISFSSKENEGSIFTIRLKN